MSYCSPEGEYLMISCRPHYLPKEFSSVFFIAVYIPPQSEAGTETALIELYSAISKQENTHAGNPLYQISISMSHVQPEGEKKLCTTFTPHKGTHTKLSLALHLANLTIFYPPDSCLQATNYSSDLINKKNGQMKQMLCYRTVLLAQTGICSGIPLMALKSTPHQSISATMTSSPQ
jgi:hypothetical protein